LDKSPVSDFFRRLGARTQVLRDKKKHLATQIQPPRSWGAWLRRRGEKKQISSYAEAESAQNREQLIEVERSKRGQKNKNRRLELSVFPPTPQLLFHASRMNVSIDIYVYS
jgi:hypothetical protein